MPENSTPRINMERFWSTIERSASIGQGRPGGLSRLTLSDADKEMRDVFAEWCQKAGLEMKIDAAGNMLARRKGREDSLPPVVMGSHLDTQANGGRFDGILGVLGGVEVCRALDEAGHVTKRPLVVANWTNEEGARFSPPMMGAGTYVGRYSLEWMHDRRDDAGVRLGDELKRIGYMGNAAMAERFDAYFELHIEQGPILDREGMQVGIVTGGYTSTGMLIEFKGETAHTGPCPMELRRNALVAGARLLTAADDIGWAFAASGGKGTAARLLAWPNKPGILSDWAQVVTDVRHADPRISAVMAEALRRAVGEAAAKANCEFSILDTWTWGGEIFDADLVGMIRAATQRRGYRHMDIYSQAGHDAYFVAEHAPTAMIFTPCKGGITHNNNELCTPDDLAPGLSILLDVVCERADR